MNHITEQPPHLLNKRIDVIDGFRGLAIILVLCYHYLPFFSFGWVGVDLFFVLSGLLITGKLVESLGRKNYFLSFYLKRILRIVPLYFAVLLVFFIVLPLVWPAFVSHSFHDLLSQQHWYWSFTINIYDAFYRWPDNILFVPFWSLGCEMQFYLVWPFFVAFIYQWNKKYFAFMLVALVFFAMLFRVHGSHIANFSSAYTYVLLPSRADAFAMGSLLYILFSEGWLTKALRIAWMYSFVALLFAISIILYEGNAWHFDTVIISKYGFTLNAVFWGGIIACTKTGGNNFLLKVFNNKWLMRAGKYSYGIYILHVPVKVIVLKLIADNSSAASIYYTAILLAVVVTITLSYASYHLLEKRFLNYKRYV